MNKQENPSVWRRTVDLLVANRLLLLIVLGAIMLRLYRLGSQSLWIDEVISMRIAMQPLQYSIAFQDPTPPLYYIVLTLWNKLFTSSEYTAYLLSVICGVLLVIVMYFFVKRFFSKRAALIATTLTALNPVFIYYSQEIRVYSLFFLVGLLSLWAYLVYKEKPTTKSAVIYGITAVALLYLHIYGAIVVFAQAISLIIHYLTKNNSASTSENIKKLFLKASLLVIAIFVLYIPGLIRLYTVLGTNLGAWIPQPDGWWLWYMLRTFVSGQIYPYALFPLALAFLGLVIVAIVWIKKKKIWNSNATKLTQIKQLDNLKSIIIISSLTILIPFFLSYIVQPFFTIRYVLVAAVFLIPVIAVVISYIPKKSYRYGLIWIFCICFFITSIAQANFTLKDDWREASAVVKAEAVTKPIFVTPIYDALALSFYIHKDCLVKYDRDSDVYECLADDNIYPLANTTEGLPFVVKDFVLVTDSWINTTQGSEFISVVNQTYILSSLKLYQLHTSKTIPLKWQSALDSNSKFPSSFSEIYLISGVHR